MFRQFIKCSLLLLVFTLVHYSQQKTDETEARVADDRQFALSNEARSAGIDGNVLVGLNISDRGEATGIRIFGSPMWPCGQKRPDEIDNVLSSLKEYTRNLKFEPARKKGKPRSSDVQITISLSELFKNAGNYKKIEDDLTKGVFPALVEIADIQKLAVDLPKQLGAVRNSQSYAINEIQVMVDETGKVVSAGGLRLDPRFLTEARSLACNTTYKPLTVKKIHVKVTGRYFLRLY